MHYLLICRTCPRDGVASGVPGSALAVDLSVSMASLGVHVLRVNCLGACRQPCAVALDSPTKARLRFSNLEVTDARALESVVRRYCASDSGRITREELPVPLRGRLSALAPKTGAAGHADTYSLGQR